VGDTLTYTVHATATGSGTGTIINAVTVTAPGGVLDSSTANNTGADVDNVGPALSTLTVNKVGTGTVTTVPGGINCGTGCTTANADYPTGSQVVLYESAPPGSIFAGWSGGGCSGTASSCTVTLAGATLVTANFTTPLTVTPVVGANGTVSPNTPQPVAPNGTTSFTVTPDAGYAAQITDNCATGGAQTGGTLVGNIYTTHAIAQNCNINFTFTNAGVKTVTPTVSAHGLVSTPVPKTVLTGGSASFTVVPDSGYIPEVSGTCPAGAWSGGVYTISPVTADCSVNFTFVDPSGVVYDSASRLPIAGATVTLLYNGGNADACVVGGSATQATNAAGQYGFLFNSAVGCTAGTYSLTVSRAGYTFASTVIPPQVADWPLGGGSIGTVGAPTGLGATTYHLHGPLPTADVTNNNIPLDAIPVVAAAPIPTLSESMMVILASLLLLFGFASMRRHTM
jgi:hypothetical protein